jgi:hypothetical protein
VKSAYAKEQPMHRDAPAQINHRDPRQAFRLPWGHVPTLSASRRRYVESFFRLLGFEAAGLGDGDLAQVFSLLARVEEYATHHRRKGQNWELDYSSLERSRQAGIPVVDRWARDWADRGLLKPLEGAPPRWPDGKRFALCLTHDVDNVSGDVLWPRLRSLPAFRAAPWREKAIVAASTARALARKLLPSSRPRDPLLAEWIEEEAKHNFTSSFFFFAQPLPAPNWRDGFYRYSDCVDFGGRRVTIAQVMKEIADQGWDVGLHGSANSHRSAALLAKERRIVSDASGQEVITIRQHHLCCDARLTPVCQAQAGFRADSTFGSNLRACFRCGTGLPFFWYDLVNDCELDLLEAPLVVQDGPLFRVSQMDQETACRHCVAMMREAAELGGAMTLLWHNIYHSDDVGYRVYRIILEEASRLGAWGCSLRQLSDWWRKRRRTLDAIPADCCSGSR